MSRALLTLALLVSTLPLLHTSARAEAAAPKPGRAIIILDASGSMYGQIKGKTKIDIAKEVIGTLVADLPAGLQLGLMAYGHREKGSCDDIELLIPPGPVDKTKFMAAVKAVDPKGKTPLSAAVEQAADYLKSDEDRASVILITDGIETCDKSPCDVGQTLAKRGLNFHVHIVGFDMTSAEGKTVACLARATGGLFLAANDAGTLRDALETAVHEAAVAPVPSAPAAAEEKKAPEPLGKATVSAPTNSPVGAEVSVAWTGPNLKGDYITFVTNHAPEGDYLTYVYTKEGSPVKITAPIKTGSYEVRYVDARTGKTLGTAAIQLTPVTVSLKAPAETSASSKVAVDWVGPNYPGDYITIVAPGAEEGSYTQYSYTKDGNPAQLNTGDATGSFELRYVSGLGGKTLASTPIKLLTPTAKLTAPTNAMAGSTISIDWLGPNNDGDYLTVVPIGSEEGTYKAYVNTHDGNPAKLQMPLEPGPIELRYMSRDGHTLARTTLTLTKASYLLTVPASVEHGARIDVAWSAPNFNGDYITIVKKEEPEGSYHDYFNTYGAAENPGHLTAPDEPGEYEVRYVNGGDAKTAAAQPIRIK